MKPTIVDLFSGIGVGALGFARAGFKIAAALDIDSRACGIYERNLGITPIVADIRKFSGRDVLDRIGLRPGEVSVVVGCPPCQGFSTLRRTRLKYRERDDRKSLLRIFGQRVAEIRPDTVVLENVKGFTHDANRRFLREFVRQMESIGYSCVFRVLNAADYGTPQLRKRLILIGVRGQIPVLSSQTHSNIQKTSDGMRPWKTVREAIGDLPPLKPGESCKEISLHAAAKHSKSVLRIIRNIPHNGGGRRSLPENLWLPCHKELRARKQRGAESVYGRMRWDTPSPTITTRSHLPSTGRFLHPTQNRAITLREAARLQSIPDDFEITGGKDLVGQWIGNAMPVSFAEAIANQVRAYV